MACTFICHNNYNANFVLFLTVDSNHVLLVIGEEISVNVSPCTLNEVTYDGADALAITYNPGETHPAKQQEERDSYQTFLNEVTKVKHPSIVQVLGVDRTHEFPVLVIENLEPLAHYCTSDNQAISEVNQLSFLMDIANAILSFQDPCQEQVKIKPDTIFVQRSNGNVQAKYCPMFGFSYFPQTAKQHGCIVHGDLKWFNDICKLLHLRGNLSQLSELPDSHILKHLSKRQKPGPKAIYNIMEDMEKLYSRF